MTITELISVNVWNNNKADKKLQCDIFKRAKRELREDDVIRNQSLEIFKEWIKKHEDIKNCVLDDIFLLRFLRVKKFSIPMAQQTLLKYLNFRKRFREFMYDLNFEDTKVYELINSGYIYVSPKTDANGRRIVMYNTSKFDPHHYNGTHMAKAHTITYETLLNNEENQILGICHVVNLGDMTPAYLTLFSIADFATIIRWGEQSFPMRHKEIHLVNMPTTLRYVFDFAKNNMSQKIRERIVVHSSFKEVAKKIDRGCLTVEFGGELEEKNVIEGWKSELLCQKAKLMELDKIDLLSDRGIIRRKNAQKNDSSSNGIGSVAGSFRKLQVD